MIIARVKTREWIAILLGVFVCASFWCIQPAYAVGDLQVASLQLGEADELTTARSDSVADRQPLYRLYNARTGEHHYTLSWYEATVCMGSWGWAYEGIAWYAPSKSSVPVYRLYSPSLNMHHYTTNAYERDYCVAHWGWNNEGIAWYSEPNKTAPLYRLYHPETQHHHYTLSAYEKDVCVRQWGWRYEGVSWYGFTDGPVQTTSKISGDTLLDAQLRAILQYHGSLRAAYDYVKDNFTYRSGNTHGAGTQRFLSDGTTIAYAKEMLEYRSGNCYRFAALFSWLARGLGYNTNVVQGWVPSYSGGQAAHGWTEVYINGQTYICDPDMAEAVPYINWYLRTYADPPTNYGSW